MAEVVNLRQARKRADRARSEETAARNRASHGIPKAERHKLEAEAKRFERRLDGAKRTGPDADDGR